MEFPEDHRNLLIHFQLLKIKKNGSQKKILSISNPGIEPRYGKRFKPVKDIGHSKSGSSRAILLRHQNLELASNYWKLII